MAGKNGKEIQFEELEREKECLKTKLALAEAKAQTYKEDFQAERRDRERAQSQIEEMEEIWTRMHLPAGIGMDPELHGQLRRHLVASGEHRIPIAAPMLQGVVPNEALMRQHESEIGRLEEQIRTYRKAEESLQHQWSKFQANKTRELDDAHKQVAALSAENARLVTENQRLQTNNDHLWNTVSRQEAHNTELKNTMVRKVLPTSSQVQSLPDLQHQLAESERRCSCLVHQLQESKKTIGELEQQCQSLGQDVDDREREKRSLQRQLGDLESRHQDLQEELAKQMSEQGEEETENRQEKEEWMERHKEAERDGDTFKSRREQVSPLTNPLATEIYQRMEQLESANQELSNKLTGLMDENSHLRLRQKTVHMRVSSRLQETGESLRHQQLDGVGNLESEIEAIWDILRDLQLTGDRNARDASGKGLHIEYSNQSPVHGGHWKSPGFSPYLERAPPHNASTSDSNGYGVPMSVTKEELSSEVSDDLSWEDLYCLPHPQPSPTTCTRPVPKPRKRNGSFCAS